MNRIKPMVAACVGAVLALSIAAPATAHKKLPPNKYHCYYWNGMSFTYSTFDLKIKANKKYVFLQGAESVGKSGSFSHNADSQRVRFKSGYLHSKNFKGKHDHSQDGHTIRLTKKMKDGSTFSYSCAD